MSKKLTVLILKLKKKQRILEIKVHKKIAYKGEKNTIIQFIDEYKINI